MSVEKRLQLEQFQNAAFLLTANLKQRVCLKPSVLITSFVLVNTVFVLFEPSLGICFSKSLGF